MKSAEAVPLQARLQHFLFGGIGQFRVFAKIPLLVYNIMVRCISVSNFSLSDKPIISFFIALSNERQKAGKHKRFSGRRILWR
jgi:hypothetical protein